MMFPQVREKESCEAHMVDTGSRASASSKLACASTHTTALISTRVGKRNFGPSDTESRCSGACSHAHNTQLDDGGSTVQCAVLALGAVDGLGVGDGGERNHFVERDPP